MTRTDWMNALQVWEAALVDAFGKDADHLRYTSYGRGAEGSALRAAWEARVAADREYHKQFAA